ncbi:MAG: hypothetical protein QOE24_375, partial [Frankiales bacterium]|nr:hypothetical protein [Frankiales bacterium]
DGAAAYEVGAGPVGVSTVSLRRAD